MREGLSYDDVLLVPQKSGVDSRSDVSLSTTIGNELLDLPIVSSPMDSVTQSELAIELGKQGGLGIIHRYQSVDRQVGEVSHTHNSGYPVGAAIGVDEKETETDYLQRAERLVENEVEVLCIDVAHGHLEKAIEATREISDTFPQTTLMAGAVATGAGVRDLWMAGADIIRVGVGSGSHCTTRKVTGVGVPQFTAVRDAVEKKETIRRQAQQLGENPKEYTPTIVADGGIRQPGDAAKALMAGADAVMMGGEFGHCEEAAADMEVIEGKQFNVTRGQSTVGSGASEGVEKYKQISGTVEELVESYGQGLRSAISYCGGNNLEDAQENAEFITVSRSTQKRNGSF